MLPLYLSIEGLYSYQDKQEIDFTKLTEAGLFGIFGNVGSGKSSILEAISFALYGETERLNKQEKRTYNMLNLKSDAARIVFEFLNFENCKFRFVAQWKRRKKFEDTTTLERYAYEWLEEEWKPLESADGALVTHLTYPNFRRTIIIPQGQFKEFLELKGKDRSEMMKDIFHLQRFDLGGKVSYLQRQNNSRLDNLKGVLSGFETVSAEVIESKKTELETAQVQLKTVREEVLSLEDHCKKLNESLSNRKELSLKKGELQLLQQQRPKVQQMETDVQVYERTQQVFRELLNQAQTLNKDKEQLTHKIEQLTAKKQYTLEQLEQKEQEWNAIADDYKQLGRFRAEIEDLKLLTLNRQSEQQRAVLFKRLEDGKPFLEQELKNEQEIQAQIVEKEQLMDSLRESKVDTMLLLAMENWFQTQDNLLTQTAEGEKQLRVLEEEIVGIQQEFTTLSLNTDTWETHLSAEETRLQQELNELQQSIMQVQVQVKLSEFAENLHEGDPCPLCGATEHPHIRQGHDLVDKMQELNNRKIQLQQELETVKRNFNQLNRSYARLKDKYKQQEQWKATLSEGEQKKQLHLEAFVWEGFSPSDRSAFLSYKEQSQNSESKIRENEMAIKTLRQQLLQNQGKVEKYKATLAEFAQKITVLDGLVQQNRGQLRTLREEDLAENNEETLQQLKEQLESKVLFLEESYLRLSQTLQDLKTGFAAVNAERAVAKEQFQQLYQQLNQCQSEISNLLVEYGFNDITEVQQVLRRNLDVAAIRKNIHEFHVQYEVLLSKIEELDKRIADDGFTEDIHREKTELLTLKREELELQIRITGGLEKECVRLQSEFAQKEALLEEYEKLNLRKSNLTTLENLFRGAGFVNYVSSIHLRQLCAIANQRFHRLTKNSLSLTVNESNEFEVIDYLNNGYVRSVKTLSGGQSFQASLCLALALAENIQVLNKADKNFFFIDEGFGTQDRESINTVFETLQYLHKENRIVGIISHVDELKERIPKSITVVNDMEKGSQIRFN
ncbi:SbcC/MukB-like Walker B domain-containing protein [Sphingobacterium wenxiniae]|uniref:Exonuclease SbcC n=1 Tax=Sphingobacterium wenxiniae TaxID=683125 RepID=A0A1I6VTG0_9SPHI|nr:SMC family ATPase [Sphingobacterium wenxiniae]SFT17012.1 exonuclease SbcC [Sphingobacterium wenxiniae]